MSKKITTTDVEVALDLLSAQVREEIKRIKDEGVNAMKQGDYDTATSVIEFAKKMDNFAGNVDKLIAQWDAIAKQHEVEPETVKAIVNKGFFGKARKGTITTHEDFYIPLLQALVQLGGSGNTQTVVDRVGKIMEGKLKPKDFDLLPSEPRMIRWRNKVMWSRNDLVNELGYMKRDSPRGIWEISEKGRKWLENQEKSK